MSDRRRRQDGRQAWDDSDRRDRRDRDRDDRRDSRDARYRDRSPGRDRDRRRGGRDRTRSPDRRDRRDRDRRHDRDRRDDRRDDRDARDTRGLPRHRPQRSPSPRDALSPTLPTRTRPVKENSHMSVKVTSRENDRRDNDADRGQEEDVMDEDEGEIDDDEAAMQAMMGFGGFGTTKGKQVAGNARGAVKKEKKSEYRQYMNREGGFNRALSPSR